MRVKNKLKPMLQSPLIGVLTSILIVFMSNYYLQLSQNSWSFRLATKFAFSWHTEKFLLGTLVLLMFNLFIVALCGSFLAGNLFYGIGMTLLGIANAMKMSYRMEPIYPDDLKMIVEWNMLRDILGWGLFLVFIILVMGIILLFGYAFYRSLKLPSFWQKIRIVTLLVTAMFLYYAGQFNQPNNLLKKAYDRTALWIPYSQKMNYYNVGFMGGFLFNLNVEGMTQPDGYSKAAVEEIMSKYDKKAEAANQAKGEEEQPNVVYIMSESFSDPMRLDGIEFNADPLKDYRDVASQGLYSGQMLSQNYGGGTANIEFEALTGFSMELLNPQMTTPYTMMVSKEASFPSLVSTLKAQNYQTTAIHPYNTSMYKRKDVYHTFGFDQFLDEKTMKYQETLSKGGYISDESAFAEVLDLLSEDPSQPQFVHLVTMQTHMPYTNKYSDSAYQLVDDNNKGNGIENYAQDIAYTSKALLTLMGEISELDRPTVVVFWGDHLPSIYSDQVLEENEDVTAHLTEYFVYDSREDSPTIKQTVSPFYFPSLVGESSGIQTTGFMSLLKDMQTFLPAFEKDSYLYQQQWEKEIKLTQEEQEVFNDYQLVQYDIVSGEKYSKDFFN